MLGEIAALAAALSFSLASTAYTSAGRRLGASVSMALSLVISLVFLLPIHQALHGSIVPAAASTERLLILGLSSLAGFVISALLLLRAFQDIGPRLTLLIGSTSPIHATAMAWIFLGQSLPTYALIGITLVLSGVVWVVSEDSNRAIRGRQSNFRLGVVTALGAAFSQGVGFVLMSEGVSDGYPAMSASVIRTVVALVFLWAIIGMRGKIRHNLDLIFGEPRVFGMVILATLAGPVSGTTLVLVSLQFTSVGISSTLTGTTPIFLIPISFLVFGERITLRMVAGTIVAVAGVGLLFVA